MKRFPILVLITLAAVSWGQVTVKYKSLSSKKKGDYEAKVRYPIFAQTPLAGFANNLWKVAATKGFNTFIKDTKEARDEERKMGFKSREFYYGSNAVITLSRPGFLSGYFALESYTGGAHGMNWTQTINVAMVGGRPSKVALQDLLKSETDPMTTISPLVIKKLKAKGAAWVVEGQVKALTKPQFEQFVVTKSGLKYLFEPYAMGSYAEGPYDVTLTWKELDGWLDWSGPAGECVTPM